MILINLIVNNLLMNTKVTFMQLIIFQDNDNEFYNKECFDILSIQCHILHLVKQLFFIVPIFRILEKFLMIVDVEKGAPAFALPLILVNVAFIALKLLFLRILISKSKMQYPAVKDQSITSLQMRANKAFLQNLLSTLLIHHMCRYSKLMTP